MTETAMLVCEGACNGGLVQDYDEAVMRAGRTDGNKSDGLATTSNLDAEWLRVARTLKHTPHVYKYGVFKAHYACTVCKTLRRFGAVDEEDVDSGEPEAYVGAVGQSG